MNRNIGKQRVVVGLLGVVAAVRCGVEDFATAREAVAAPDAVAGAVAVAGADAGAGADTATRAAILAAAAKAGRVFFDAAGNANITHFDRRTNEVRAAVAVQRALWTAPRRPVRANADLLFASTGTVRGGRIVASDFRGTPKAWASYDANGRGFITRDDVAEVVALGRYRGERARAARIVKALDGNRDGTLTPTEIAQNPRAMALFTKLDPARTKAFTASTLAVALAKSKAARRLALMHRSPK
ncbi:MAG: EF-hand domain-containing protein [Deltaproteobacteria bacterium]|nr:EF-hand domain-containing protein [Deltaproteobacteria bacterium]